MELNIEQFDPTLADLQKIVALTKNVTVTDFKDKAQLELVHQNRIALRDVRVKITKKGKELREEATKFAKDVITHEKELIAVLEPEESRAGDRTTTPVCLIACPIRQACHTGRRR